MAVHAQTAPSDVDVPAVGLKIVVSQQGASATISLSGEWDLAEQEAAPSRLPPRAGAPA